MGQLAEVKLSLGITKTSKYENRIYGVSWAVAGRGIKKLQNVFDDFYKTQGEIL
jgi:hypothetical protein